MKTWREKAIERNASNKVAPTKAKRNSLIHETRIGIIWKITHLARHNLATELCIWTSADCIQRIHKQEPSSWWGGKISDNKPKFDQFLLISLMRGLRQRLWSLGGTFVEFHFLGLGIQVELLGSTIRQIDSMFSFIFELPISILLPFCWECYEWAASAINLPIDAIN